MSQLIFLISILYLFLSILLFIFYIYLFIFIYYLPPSPIRRPLSTRDLTKPRRRRQREHQKTIGLMSKTTTLHVHHAFLYISLPSLHYNDVKWPSFKFTWERQRQGDNINSVRTWVRSPLFSSSQNALLLSNGANWDNREKVFKNDAKSVFQRRFHGRRRCPGS